jgi:LysM repeat protein
MVFGKFDTYTVKSGVTLWSIGTYCNITVLELIKLNGLTGSLIYQNQTLKIRK